MEASIGRSGRDAIDLPDGTPAAIVRLDAPLGVAPGDRFVLRRSSGADRIVGAFVIDVAPPRGISRRRQTAERSVALPSGGGGDGAAIADARLDLHGVLEPAEAKPADPRPTRHRREVDAAILSRSPPRATVSATDRCAGDGGQATATPCHDQAERGSRGRLDLIDRLVADGRLVRDGAGVALPGKTRSTPARIPSCSTRWPGSSDRSPSPPRRRSPRRPVPPPARRKGLRELERAGRIVVLDDELAYATTTYDEITATALALATTAPLTPAALRDATGHESQVRDGDPRGSRSACDPAADAGRAHPGTAGRPSGRDRARPLEEHRPVSRRPIESLRAGQARRARRWPDPPRQRHRRRHPGLDRDPRDRGTPDAAPDLPAGDRLIHDSVAFEGPLAGVAAGLRAAHEPIVFVVGGDMPTLVGAVIESMLATLDTPGVEAVVLEHDGGPVRCPVALRREPAIGGGRPLLADGERRLRHSPRRSRPRSSPRKRGEPSIPTA